MFALHQATFLFLRSNNAVSDQFIWDPSEFLLALAALDASAGYLNVNTSFFRSITSLAV